MKNRMIFQYKDISVDMDEQYLIDEREDAINRCLIVFLVNIYKKYNIGPGKNYIDLKRDIDE